MKMHGEVKVKFSEFLILILAGDEWTAQCFDSFVCLKGDPLVMRLGGALIWPGSFGEDTDL